MTAPDIVTEARQLLDAATPGQWEVRDKNFIYGTHPQGGKRRVASCAWRTDAPLIAAAPRLVTDLVAEVERLRERVRRWEMTDALKDDTDVQRQWVETAEAERDAALAEVERLRQKLDQRTDPDVLSGIPLRPETKARIGELDRNRAARLLGGDQ